MTKQESKHLQNGLYVIYWKSGGSSLAAVGILHNGERWYAPTNWTNKSTDGIACSKWSGVERVKLINH